jgi:ribose transport system ATP-binding protein
VATEALLELRDLNKTFAANRALIDTELTIYPGEVHGLLGANGSGKSTMLKILSGAVKPDSEPELFVRGRAAPLPEAGSYRRYGWGFVHQDLGLLPTLRVVDNLQLSGPLRSPGAAISWRRELRSAQEVLARFHLDIDPRTRVERLSAAQRALLAIARAMHEAQTLSAGDNRLVLFLDESTVSLEIRDREEVEAVMTDVIRQGCAVVLVSHDLAEVRQLTHRVTVLRDGRIAGSGRTTEIPDQRLLTMVVGEALSSEMDTRKSTKASSIPPETAPALQVRQLAGPAVNRVDFDCYPGEVLGLTGLVGSGYEEIPYLIFGHQPQSVADGTVAVGGITLSIAKMRPDIAIKNGICLVPGSRATQGGVSNASIWQNVTLPSLDRYRNRYRKLLRKQERAAAEKITRDVDLRPPGVTRRLGALSGGNQQKVVVAKWLNAEPKVLLLHEPTIGIDVGARSQLHKLLRQAASERMAVICVSGDYDQLEVLCDRVLVFRHGRIHAELRGPQISKRKMTLESLDDSGD